ncbi:MAG TPA: DUF1573 domain-containing protein [Planctomycetota bacterium]|nr:DUF1573 domain-containing protein [Planctomycetota bacterium]
MTSQRIVFTLAIIAGFTLSLSPRARGQDPKDAPKPGVPAPPGVQVEDAKAASSAGQASVKPAVQKVTPGKRVFRPLPPPANFSPPIAEVDAMEYDWGSVLQGEVVKHTYTITNRGGAPLIVTQVKPSCGCSTSAKPERPIEPGQSGEVTLNIDTKKFSGPVSKTADIFTNASAGPPLKVTMKGKVDPFFTMEPTAPKLDVVRGVIPVPTKVTLKRSSKVELKVKELKTESKVLQPTLNEVTPGEVYEVVLAASLTEDPRKYYYEEIHIKLDVDGKELDVPIRVSVTVKDRIDVQPRTSVYFSRNETKALKEPGSSALSKVLEIKSLGGPDHVFKLTGVKQQGQTPNFDTKIETVTEGKHYRILVQLSKLPEDTKLRTLRDTIVIQTDDPTIKELKVTALAALQ